MAELTIATSSIEKLNSNNYDSWSVLVQLYLEGQGLWSLVEGKETTEPTDPNEKKKWKMRAGKAKFVMASTVENEFLQRIKKAETPKEAWDTLAALFAKTNEAKLQQLENELISTKQRDLSTDIPDPAKFPFVIIGNKIDVDGGANRVVSEKRAKEWVQSIKTGVSGSTIPYFETSAKEDLNVDDAFLCIAKAALSHERTQDIYFESISGSFSEIVEQPSGGGCPC